MLQSGILNETATAIAIANSNSPFLDFSRLKYNFKLVLKSLLDLIYIEMILAQYPNSHTKKQKSSSCRQALDVNDDEEETQGLNWIFPHNESDVDKEDKEDEENKEDEEDEEDE